MYDLAALERALAGTIFAGKLHFSPVTGSTNTDALRLPARERRTAQSTLPMSNMQAADAAITLAIGRRAGIVCERAAAAGAAERRGCRCLPLAAGLAAAEAIRRASGLTVDLRWPNDLLIGERKTGGILVESKIEGDGGRICRRGHRHQRSPARFRRGLATPATSLDSKLAVAYQPAVAADRPARIAGARSAGLLDPAAVAAIPKRVESASTWIAGGALKCMARRLARASRQGWMSMAFCACAQLME